MTACLLLFGLVAAPNWAGWGLLSAKAVTLPKGTSQNWASNGIPAPLVPPTRVQAISEDGRLLVCEYPTGGSITGSEIQKIVVQAVADGHTVEMGIPRVQRSGSRLRIVVDALPTNGAASNGFVPPIYDEDDTPRYWLESALDAGHAAFGFHMYSQAEHRRYAGEALAEIGEGRWGNSVTLAEPLRGEQSGHLGGWLRISRNGMTKAEIVPHTARQDVYIVTYDWLRRKATPHPLGRVPLKDHGYNLGIAAVDPVGGILIEASRAFKDSIMLLQVAGRRGRVPNGQWQFWRGRLVRFDKGNFKVWRGNSVRTLATGLDFMASNSDGRWILVRRLADNQPFLLHFE